MSRWWKMPRSTDSEFTNILTWGSTNRTNLLLQSEDFSTTWENIRTTDTASSEVTPRGDLTADTLQEDGTATATHYIRQNITSWDGSSTYTVSCFAKKANRDFLILQLPDSAFPAACQAYFNLNTGVVGTLGGGEDSTSIIDYGNGWYKCSVTGTSDTATSGYLAIYTAASDGTSSFSGLSQDSIHIWAAQLEIAAQATPYISTTTVARTISGITLKNNFIDDVHACLENITEDTGSLDDLYKKYKRGH